MSKFADWLTSEQGQWLMNATSRMLQKEYNLHYFQGKVLGPPRAHSELWTAEELASWGEVGVYAKVEPRWWRLMMAGAHIAVGGILAVAWSEAGMKPAVYVLLALYSAIWLASVAMSVAKAPWCAALRARYTRWQADRAVRWLIKSTKR